MKKIILIIFISFILVNNTLAEDAERTYLTKQDLISAISDAITYANTEYSSDFISWATEMLLVCLTAEIIKGNTAVQILQILDQPDSEELTAELIFTDILNIINQAPDSDFNFDQDLSDLSYEIF